MEEPFRMVYRVIGVIFFLTSISKINEISIYQHAQTEALRGIEKNTERISVEVNGQLANIHYQAQRLVDKKVKPLHVESKSVEEKQMK